MARKQSHPDAGKAQRSPGYRACLLDTDDASAQPRSKRDGKKPERPTPRATPEKLVLVGGDRYIVAASGSRIQFYRYDDLSEEGRATRPIAQVVAAAWDSRR